MFAPTDAAVETLQRELGVQEPSPEITCALPAATVFDILAYDVTDGRRFSNSLFNKRATRMIEMLNCADERAPARSSLSSPCLTSTRAHTRLPAGMAPRATTL